MLREFYNGKRVFVTGHTGFKGSWLTQMLLQLGSEVTGYALSPPTEPSLFSLRHLEKEMHSITGDIRDGARLQAAVREARPEVLIHMAARSLVSEGYEDPAETYDVNLMGTVHALEAARACDSLCSVLVITTDKVYRNSDADRAFSEGDALGATDPYASSKVCAEMAAEALRESFLAQRGVAVSTLRAGNVIGGGDFAKDRLVPDCVRAVTGEKPLTLRYPDATRPYQHVPKPLALYLRISAEQAQDISLAGAYNVGPERETATREIVTRFFDKWDAATGSRTDIGAIRADAQNAFREAQTLRLDSTRAMQTFGFVPGDTIDTALDEVIEFTQLHQSGADLRAHMETWVDHYLEK